MLEYISVIHQSLRNAHVMAQLLQVRDGFPRDKHYEGTPGYRDYDMVPVFVLYKELISSVLKTE